jgi:hypothetical protein
MKITKYLGLLSLPLLMFSISFAQVYDFDCPNIPSNLSIGQTDSTVYPRGQVSSLQQFLKDFYGSEAFRVDGKFRTPTANMVKLFQGEHGLVITGRVGAATRARIYSMCNPVGPTTPLTPTIPYTPYAPYNPPVQQVPSVCIPQVTQTQELGCTGGSGTFVQQRVSYCPAGATTPSWFDWVTIRSSCLSGGSNSTVNPPTLSVQPQAITIANGKSLSIIAYTTNTSSCTINGGNYNNQMIPVGGRFVVTPTQSTTYNISCVGVNGQYVSGQSTVNVVADNGNNPPTAYIQPLVSTVSPGQAQILTLYTTSVSSCTINGGNYNAANVNPNGTFTVNPTQTTTYTANCIGNNGQLVTAQAVVNVNINGSSPYVSIQTSTTTIPSSQTVTLNIVSSNVNSCFISGYGMSTQSVQANGSFPVTPTQTSTYVVTCKTSSGQNVSSQVTIYVGTTTSTTTAPYVSVSPSNGFISWGQSQVLTITSSNVTTCNITSPGWAGVGVPVNGQYTVSPTVTTTYTVTCAGTNGQSVSAQAMVNVSVTGGGTDEPLVTITNAGAGSSGTYSRTFNFRENKNVVSNGAWSLNFPIGVTKLTVSAPNQTPYDITPTGGMWLGQGAPCSDDSQSLCASGSFDFHSSGNYTITFVLFRYGTIDANTGAGIVDTSYSKTKTVQLSI